VQPLIYGYLRLRSDTPEDDVARARQELTNYAEREGFTVAEIFLEARDLPGAAFNGLTHAITRTETKDIVVCDPADVGAFHEQGTPMTSLLEVAGARVWVTRE
nr:hypothetical protein [Geodermatophilaceae bacterium]